MSSILARPFRVLAPLRVLTIIVLAAGLAACAGTRSTTQAADEYAPNDPLEDINRPIFAFNKALDDYALKPVAKGYRTVLPEFARDGVRNFLRNLRTPIILANEALQGDGEQAGKTFARFWMNTVLGLGGLIDVGVQHGFPFHDEDFGQTLAVWGVPDGPYLMLPVLGPSNVRDTVGIGVDAFADPVNRYFRGEGYDWAPYARSFVAAVDARSRNIETFDKIESTSLDYYATIRSLYRQRRAADIRNDDDATPAASPLSSQLPPDEAPAP
jgi:phospholipid-binding lipoprotein MlaA